MKIHELFTSIDLSTELESAGIDNNTVFGYYKDGSREVRIKEIDLNDSENLIVAAFTAEEILAFIPVTLNLEDDFFIGMEKVQLGVIDESGVRLKDRDIELIIEKTYHPSNFRHIISYSYPGKTGRIGIMQEDGKILHLYADGFYLADAVGRFYLQLKSHNLIE